MVMFFSMEEMHDITIARTELQEENSKKGIGTYR